MANTVVINGDKRKFPLWILFLRDFSSTGDRDCCFWENPVLLSEKNRYPSTAKTGEIYRTIY